MIQRPLPDPGAALARFATLIERCERLRSGGLPFDELRELAYLYRQQSARLARLRDRAADPDAIRHLNALCVRAYAFLYASSAAPSALAPALRLESPPTAGSVGAGLGRGEERRPWRARIPEVLASTWRVQALAWSLLVAGAVLGGALTLRDPSALYALLPTGFGYDAGLIDRLWSSPDARSAFLAGEDAVFARNALFGSVLFAHNTEVGVLSFATGILLGIPTVLLQLYNGLTLGAFSMLFLRDAAPAAFLGWILPHAVPELTAIALCCTGGLLLGEAVAAPGRSTRRAALRRAASSALLLLAVAVPLFLLAALVESFVRESGLGTGARLAIAGALACALAAGAEAVRRVARRTAVDTSWLPASARRDR